MNTRFVTFLALLQLLQNAEGLTRGDNRMVAFLGNWQSCPSASQLAQYTHVLVAFAVTYTWDPSKNICSPTCDISDPPICNNSPNPALISSLHAAGKKVILSFGGAGMGGSWAGDVNNCWDYCFGRESQVVARLVQIVTSLGLDGVDIDYEYFYKDYQNGSGFNKGAAAIKFLSNVTTGLRKSLPAGSLVTHTPMDSDLVAGTDYYKLLQSISSSIDLVMPQFYNGYTRPALDGFSKSGAGSMAASVLYSSIVTNFFGGDATRIVFGFCISDCSGTGSNANAAQAASVMTQIGAAYSCNGGAFFWVAENDSLGAWSTAVNAAMTPRKGCSVTPSAPAAPSASVSPPVAPAPTPVQAPTPTAPSPVAPAPVKVPTPTAPLPVAPAPSPVKAPTPTAPTPVAPSPVKVPTAPSPVKVPTAPSPLSFCCPSGFTGYRPYSSCTKFYQCVFGQFNGATYTCSTGLLFDKVIQNCNWPSQVVCTVDTCV